MTNQRIEIAKEDFVALAVYASCAELPEKENRYEMILRRIMDSLDKEDAVVITKDMLALKAKIEMLNGKSIEDIVNALLDGMMEDDE